MLLVAKFKEIMHVEPEDMPVMSKVLSKLEWPSFLCVLTWLQGPLLPNRKQRSAVFFCKVSDGKDFRLCRPCNLCRNYSTSLFEAKAAIGNTEVNEHTTIVPMKPYLWTFGLLPYKKRW